MVEVERTLDPVRLSVVRSVLGDAGIEAFLFDSAAGALWSGAIPTRVMVLEDDLELALRAIAQAGL
jgi:hypothetical protein